MSIRVKYNKPVTPGDDVIETVERLKSMCASIMDVDEDDVSIWLSGWDGPEGQHRIVLSMNEDEFRALLQSECVDDIAIVFDTLEYHLRQFGGECLRNNVGDEYITWLRAFPSDIPYSKVIAKIAGKLEEWS